MRRLLGAVLIAVALALPASAVAWRQPTPSERKAITHAAEHAQHGGNGKVYVSRIHVSTVGPWASAELTVYFGSAPDNAIDILHKVHGSWTNAQVGSEGFDCAMPQADEQNLFGQVNQGCGGRQ